MSDLTGARTVEETTTGYVQDLLTQVDGNNASPQQISTLFAQVRLILDAVNGRLSFGDGKQSSKIGNIDGVNVQYKFTAVGRVEKIPHNLGRKPVGYVVVGQQFSAVGAQPPHLISCGSDGGVLYGGGDNRVDAVPTDWDNRMVYFRVEGDASWLPGLYRIWLF